MPGITRASQIPKKVYFRIGDVADLLSVKPHVLRYWESEFTNIIPEKSPTGQRVYKRSDVEKLFVIRHFLYNEYYSIKAAKKRIKELKKNSDLKSFKESLIYGNKEQINFAKRIKNIFTHFKKH